MKSALIALATLVAASGAHAYPLDPTYPLDIENDARWLVLDGMPEQYSRLPSEVEFVRLRSRDLSMGEVSLAAVCGALDFGNADEGVTNFVLLYASDGRGAVVPIGRPFFYGDGAERSLDPQHRLARVACGDGEDRPLAAKLPR